VPITALEVQQGPSASIRIAKDTLREIPAFDSRASRTISDADYCQISDFFGWGFTGAHFI
jgi:hypothetical protein